MKCILLLYQNVDMVAKSSLPVFDPEYVSNRQPEWTSLQTLASNSTHHCLPAQAWKVLRTKKKKNYSLLVLDQRETEREDGLTCVAEAAEMVPVLPSEAEEASRQQNVLGPMPHREAL